MCPWPRQHGINVGFRSRKRDITQDSQTARFVITKARDYWSSIESFNPEPHEARCGLIGLKLDALIEESVAPASKLKMNKGKGAI